MSASRGASSSPIPLPRRTALQARCGGLGLAEAQQCEAIGRDPSTLERLSSFLISPADADFHQARETAQSFIEAGANHIVVNIGAFYHQEEIIPRLLHEAHQTRSSRAMSFMLLLLQDPGMLPGGFGWKTTWKRVCRRRAVAIHISPGKGKPLHI